MWRNLLIVWSYCPWSHEFWPRRKEKEGKDGVSSHVNRQYQPDYCAHFSMFFVILFKRGEKFSHYMYLRYCTREVKMKIVIAKEAFYKKMSLLTSKLNIELKKKLVRCYVLSIA